MKNSVTELRIVLKQRSVGLENCENTHFVDTICIGGGGGQFEPCDAKFSEKVPCLQNNNIALIEKNFPVRYSALVIPKVLIQNKIRI